MGMEEYTPEKRAAASPGPWLDIASAPKDGTHFLWAGDNGEFARRRWTLSVIWWPEFEDCFNSGHWQPLPAPPGSEAPVPDEVRKGLEDIDRDYENQDISHHDFRVNTKVAVDDLLARWGK